MQRPKYKLVCTIADRGYQVGDILTTNEDTIHFGGPWGWMQDEHKAEWQENLPTAEDIKQENNTNILSQITALEPMLIRPMRELLSTAVTDKSFAQAKVDDIERQIQALRAQIIK